MARNIMGLPSLSATPPPPVLMKEHIEELKRKAKEDAEKDRGKALWDAKTVLVGYKPGSGVLQVRRRKSRGTHNESQTASPLI